MLPGEFRSSLLPYYNVPQSTLVGIRLLERTRVAIAPLAYFTAQQSPMLLLILLSSYYHNQ